MHRYLSGGFPAGVAYVHWAHCPTCQARHLVTLGDDGPCERCADTAKRAALRRRYERRTRNTVGPRYVFEIVAERDGWRCHLCGKPVDKTVSRRDPRGATIDHLIPVSLGGGDEPENVALAHRSCNIHRGVRGEVQLRLVG